jgi:asparaginyl-tRNA synthetase
MNSQLTATSHQSQTYQALTLTLESSVELAGTLNAVPVGQTAPGGHELMVDYWHVIGAAPGADDAFTNRLNEVCLSFSTPLSMRYFYCA